MREDKGPEDASSPADIVDLYRKQTRKMVVAGGEGGERFGKAGTGPGPGQGGAKGTGRLEQVGGEAEEGEGGEGEGEEGDSDGGAGGEEGEGKQVAAEGWL